MLALITGASRGIGAAIAYELAKNNYDLILVGRNEKRLRKVCDGIQNREEVIAIPIKCDITDKDQRKKLLLEVSRYGKLNVLINNAGIAAYKKLSETQEREIEKIINTNLTAHMLLTKMLLQHLTKNAIIINISSAAGLEGHAKLTAYCASKFGLIGFTEALGEELEGKHKVFAVCPGDTQTKMWEKIFPGIPATFTPEDVAFEVIKTIKNAKKLRKRVIKIKKSKN